MNDVLSRWDRIYKGFKDRNEYIKERSGIHFKNDPPLFRFSSLSDTIIITAAIPKNTPSGYTEAKTDLTLFMAGVVMVSFFTSLENQFYLRGAISTGTFWLSDKMIIGPAIDEAANYHNKLNWVGVATTPSASSVLKNHRDNDNRLVNYHSIPWKNGNREGWALAWPLHDNRNSLYNPTRIGWRMDILLNASNYELDESIRTKYANTLKFYDFCVGTSL